MRFVSHLKAASTLALAASMALMSGMASAYELQISGYGNTISGGFPFSVAMEGGFFKKAGVDITAIRGSDGGTADVRGLMAGDMPYAVSSLAPVLNAADEGVDLKIIDENVHSAASVVWVTLPNSPIKSIKDLKGARIGFTAPQSAAYLQDLLLIEKAGLTTSDVKLIAGGSFGAQLTMLENGALDVVNLTEPVYTMNKSKYKVLATVKDELPPMNGVVGITTGKIAREHPDVLRGILLARRNALNYMKTNRKESVALVGKVFKLDPAIIETVMTELVDHGDTQGISYWSQGDIYAPDMDNAVKGLKQVGAIKGEGNWRKLVDQSFLPDDLKSKLN